MHDAQSTDEADGDRRPRNFPRCPSGVDRREAGRMQWIPRASSASASNATLPRQSSADRGRQVAWRVSPGGRHAERFGDTTRSSERKRRWPRHHECPRAFRAFTGFSPRQDLVAIFRQGTCWTTGYGVLDMSEFITSDVISRRRVLSLVGWAAALGLAAPAAVLTASDVEAQTSGMERRGERRTGRHERRQTRRTGRTERREERRD